MNAIPSLSLATLCLVSLFARAEGESPAPQAIANQPGAESLSPCDVPAGAFRLRRSPAVVLSREPSPVDERTAARRVAEVAQRHLREVVGDGATALVNIPDLPDTCYTNVWTAADTVRALDGTDQVTVPEGVDRLDVRAFAGSRVRSLSLPSTLRAVGERAFADCPVLEAVVLPDSVEVVGSSLFANDPALRSVVFPKPLRFLPGGQFAGNCAALREVRFPEKSLAFGANMFLDNPGIEHVELPEGVVCIHDGFFARARNLRSVRFPKSLRFIPTDCFLDCPTIEEIEIPEGVAFIGRSTFQNCPNLRKLVLPASVQVITARAFQHTPFESVTFLGPVPEIRSIDGGPAPLSAMCLDFSKAVFSDAHRSEWLAAIEKEKPLPPFSPAPKPRPIDMGAQPSEGQTPLRASAMLVDSSVLHGALPRRFVPAVSPTLGRIRIDLRAVKSMEFERGKNAVISFRNGDRLTVRFPADLKPLRFDTVLGPVPLPLSAVSKLVLEPSTSSTPSTLLYHCTFDSPESISRPAAGPGGAFLGGEFVPGRKGRALLVKARTPAAEVPFPTGLMQPEGCIEFWAKIPGATKETRYPDGGNPQFFAMGVGKWVNTFVKYTANDGFGTGGLHADLPGSSYVSSLPSWSGSATYPDFLGNPSAWHHYALVWSEKGLDAASEALGRRVVSALYVDGRLVNPAYGTNGPDRAKFLREFVVNPVVLGFPFLRERQDPNQCREDFLIDEFKIWSKPKFDLAGAAVIPERQYKPELLYHCTFDSSESIERPAAGPAGTFLGGEFVPGKIGNALRSPGDVPIAEVDLPRGMMQPRGTIEFWAKIEEPPAFYGDRGNPLFFGMWLFENPDNPGLCSTHLGWCANNGTGMAGLCGSIYHRALATDPTMRTNTYGPLLSDPAAWHHYAIVWDSEGLPFAKASDGTPAVATLVLDGRVLQTFGRNQLSKGEGLLKLPSFQGKLAFPVPAARWGNPGNHIPFLIDEFKIWSAPKASFPQP